MFKIHIHPCSRNYHEKFNKEYKNYNINLIGSMVIIWMVKQTKKYYNIILAMPLEAC